MREFNWHIHTFLMIKIGHQMIKKLIENVEVCQIIRKQIY